jgi:twitching motility protein PilT
MALTIDNLLDEILTRNASDAVLVAGTPPVMWVTGQMQPVGQDKLTEADISSCFLPLLSESQKARLNGIGDVDFSVGRSAKGRLRVNLHRQRGTLGAAVRFIPYEVPHLEDLKLPPRVLELADLPNGLVLVTGGAGTGKSTTLAALVNHMNQHYAYHIITMEDPLEFTFSHGKSVIEQREIGQDSESFGSALRHVVRQRPDVILVGEMRDLETVSAALTAAETGHLVLATLHTTTTVETINRIIDVFPGERQNQIRVQLSTTLQGVLCQRLFPDILDGRLVPAVEIMIPNTAICRAIRDSEMHLIAGMIEMGKRSGMQTGDAAIADLIRAGRISKAVGIAKAHNPEKLAKMVA